MTIAYRNRNNDLPDYGFDELLKLAGINSIKPFGEIVNSKAHGFQQLKQNFLQETKERLQYNASTIEDETKKAIELVKRMFSNEEGSSSLIIDMPEATPFVKLGFTVMCNNPTISVYQLFDELESDSSLIQLAKVDRSIYATPLIDGRFNGLKYSEVSIGVVLFEALNYIIDGAQYALYLHFLKTTGGESESEKDRRYVTLKDLFINEVEYIDAMKALRSVMPPIISDENKYLLGIRQKSAFAAWLSWLQTNGKIKSVTLDELATLLNEEIEGLDIYKDGSTLTNTTGAASKKYRTQFTKLNL